MPHKNGKRRSSRGEADISEAFTATEKDGEAVLLSPRASREKVVNPQEEIDLASQSKDFLIKRVEALERQLIIRNADCARLLQERQELLPLKQKCESQREMIVAFREQLEIAKVQRASALEAVEKVKKQHSDEEHQRRVDGFRNQLGGASPMATPVPQVRCAPLQDQRQQHQSPAIPGGTVVKTSMGPQIIYDSSDISSIGFGKQPQYMYSTFGIARPLGTGVASTVADSGEDAQVRRVMAQAQEAAVLDAKRAELEAKEEAELQARLDALRVIKPPPPPPASAVSK